MKNVNSLLNDRLKKKNPSLKMAEMAKQSADGRLTTFSGMFSVTELSEQETTFLESLLQEHANDKKSISNDLKALISITSEIKAINNQAALLHGERIKRAQQILTRYRDGAFTAWLMAAYGNRQTPYNFLQYYEFSESLPKTLKPRLDVIPRQAIYTLASRNVPFEKKQHFIENYQGETKSELLKQIRHAFPLEKSDRRRPDVTGNIKSLLNQVQDLLESNAQQLSRQEKQSIRALLQELLSQHF